MTTTTELSGQERQDLMDRAVAEAVAKDARVRTGIGTVLPSLGPQPITMIAPDEPETEPAPPEPEPAATSEGTDDMRLKLPGSVDKAGLERLAAVDGSRTSAQDLAVARVVLDRALKRGTLDEVALLDEIGTAFIRRQARVALAMAAQTVVNGYSGGSPEDLALAAALVDPPAAGSRRGLRLGKKSPSPARS